MAKIVLGKCTEDDRTMDHSQPKKVMQDRIRFIDAVLDQTSFEVLKMQKQEQFDFARTALAQACVAAHFLDGEIDTESVIGGWKNATPEDRATPAEAILPAAMTEFTTPHIMERVLRRGINVIRALPFFRAHKPMFPPYVSEIEAITGDLTAEKVTLLFLKQFDAMVTG